MALKNVVIHGVRSYGIKRKIDFSIPDGINPGSGLNIFLGPNNGGKSTIIESLDYLNKDNNHVTENVYNKNCNGFIISAQTTDDYIFRLQSNSLGAAICKKIITDSEGNIINNKQLNLFIISSKRNIDSSFGNGYVNRYSYTRNHNSSYRNSNQRSFGERLIKAAERIEKDKFNAEMSKVIYPAPDWTIKLTDTNNYYLEFKFDDITHKSIDSGDGYINLFNIIDALYDANPGDTIIVDEPEISLHPELQRNLMKLFIEHSKDKQIIIATHNIFFVNWDIFNVGGKIFRVVKENNNSNIYTLSDKTIRNLEKLDDPEKIPLLGLDSAEIFFLSDNIILTEGQEDVICYKKLFEKENYKPNASFFGWGVNGFSRMRYVLEMLHDLGYKKVFAIFDNDAKKEVDDLSKNQMFRDYELYLISADDVRDKKEKDGTIKKKGIVKSLKTLEINDEYVNEIPKMINEINDYFENKIVNINNISKPVNIITVDESEKFQELIGKYIEQFSKEAHRIMDEVYSDFGFNLGDTYPESTILYKDNIISYVNCMQGTESSKLTIIGKIIITSNNKLKSMKIIKIDNNLPYSKITKKYRDWKIKNKFNKAKKLIMKRNIIY